MMINNPSYFEAAWHPEYAPKQEGNLNKLIGKIKDFSLYIPNKIIAACINPRPKSAFYQINLKEENYQVFSKKIITPDLSSIFSTIYFTDEATSDTPTVILFNPLGANCGVNSGLRGALLEKKCNVVMFDYRGIGTTKKAQDLVVDGESVYQYVTKELGIKSEKVHFYGFSLGGAIAAKVKEIHPESGKYVGDRPFSSVFSLISEKLSFGKQRSIIKKITSFTASIFLAYPLYLLGWEWDASKMVKQIEKEKIRVIYHPKDCLIPFQASLASQCDKDQQIALDEATTGFETHFIPLDGQKVNGERAPKIVAGFFAG